MKINKKKLFSILGLLLDLIGTIFLAFSIKVFDPAVHGVSIKIGENELTLVVQNSSFLVLGIILIILGFILQLISEFFKR